MGVLTIKALLFGVYIRASHVRNSHIKTRHAQHVGPVDSEGKELAGNRSQKCWARGNGF